MFRTTMCRLCKVLGGHHRGTLAGPGEAGRLCLATPPFHVRSQALGKVAAGDYRSGATAFGDSPLNILTAK